MRAPALLLCASTARAQSHYDPFAGSGCDCDTFCAGQCSILPEPAPLNVTMYRMTPLNVDTAVDKNTGDAPGDTSYVMSRRTAAYDCAHSTDPSQNWQCALLIVRGDDPYSTDLVIGFTIETDGKWGPYLFCNPEDTSHPENAWNCTTSITLPSHEPANYPPQCKAANFSGQGGYCYTNTPSHTAHSDDLGGCCTAAINYGRDGAWGYTYYASNQSCEIYAGYNNHAAPCDGGVTGHWEQPHGGGPPPCECPRVHASVGRLNKTGHGYGHGISMGEWYSTPRGGECAPGRTPGDGSCSWISHGVSKAVNASCLYDRIDTFCEDRDPDCFSQCPQASPGYPWKYNRTTSCYSECYANALKGITEAEVRQPWDLAFASDVVSKGGCPSVTPPNH